MIATVADPVSVDVFLNRQDAPFLTAKYGAAIRYTLNPTGRRRGEPDWNAGPAEDWCEMSSQSAVVALGRPERVDVVSQGTTTRITRQRACHDMTPCTRKSPHWPIAAAS
jgi:hypothetical protein